MPGSQSQFVHDGADHGPQVVAGVGRDLALPLVGGADRRGVCDSGQVRRATEPPRDGFGPRQKFVDVVGDGPLTAFRGRG